MPLITVDLHTHLIEKREKPERYWKAAAARKIDAVAIAEHVNKSPERAYRLLLEKKPKGKTLIPAMELNTAIGHVVAYSEDDGIYSIEKLYKKNLPIRKAIAIAEKEGLLLSIAHPWGLSYDSAAYLMGEKRLGALVERGGIGVEAFNGMFGSLSSFFYRSSWIKKPMNFFDFLERSRFGRKTKLSTLGKRARRKLDKKGREVIERCAKPIQLGMNADFITAGSDAHSAAKIGSGIMKIRVSGVLGNGKLLGAVREKKGIEWVGPYLRQTKGGRLVLDNTRLGKKEFLQGLQYAAKRAVGKRVGLKRVKRIFK